MSEDVMLSAVVFFTAGMLGMSHDFRGGHPCLEHYNYVCCANNATMQNDRARPPTWLYMSLKTLSRQGCVMPKMPREWPAMTAPVPTRLFRLDTCSALAAHQALDR